MAIVYPDDNEEVDIAGPLLPTTRNCNLAPTYHPSKRGQWRRAYEMLDVAHLAHAPHGGRLP